MMTFMFFLKIHICGEKSVASVCDSEIIGKVFEECGRLLDIDADFFGGKKADIGEIISAVKSADSANIAGNRIISELLNAQVITPSGVKEISGMKFAMIFRI